MPRGAVIQPAIPDECRRKGHRWLDPSEPNTECGRCGRKRIFLGTHPDGTKRYRYAAQTEWPPGTAVQLVCFYPADNEKEIEPGETGVVTGTDDAGTIFVDWQCGTRLGVIPGFDVIKEVKTP